MKSKEIKCLLISIFFITNICFIYCANIFTDQSTEVALLKELNRLKQESQSIESKLKSIINLNYVYI